MEITRQGPEHVNDLHLRKRKKSILLQLHIPSSALQGTRICPRKRWENQSHVDQQEAKQRGYNYGEHYLRESTTFAWKYPESELWNIDGGRQQQTCISPVLAGSIISRKSLVFKVPSVMEMLRVLTET